MNETMYMNLATGEVDTRDGWKYEDETGLHDAVVEGDVVEVKKEVNGDWVEV